MAFVPELDDEKKDSSTEDTSDINNQSTTSNIASAPAPAGQAASGGGATAPAPSSSGNFQDFSKFKTANQGKLQALSNLATDSAQGGVDKAKSAFDTAGSAFQGEIQKNAKNFETSAYKNLNNNSTVDATALGKDLSEASQTVDSATQQGKLAGSQEFTNLQNNVGLASNIGNRAGTAALLGNAQSNQASAAAANQDSLLLQSMGDYRAKANQIAQANKGADTNALTTNQTKLVDTAKTVNDNNAAYKTKALEALGGLQTGLQKDLTDRAAAKTTELQSSYSTKAADAVKNAASAVRLKAEKAMKDAAGAAASSAVGSNTFSTNPELEAAQIAAGKEFSRLRDMSDEDIINTVDNDLTKSVRDYRTESAGQNVSADAIYRDDSTRQAQLSALQQLLSGKGNTYNAGALDPLESQKLNPLQMLIDGIKNQNLTNEGQWFENYINPQITNPVAPVAPAPVATPTPVQAGGSKTGKTTVTKATNNR